MQPNHPNSQNTGLMTRLAALGGVVGPIVFAMLVIVGGVLSDGYSHVTQKISELGGEGAEYALLQNINFIVLGLAVIGLSWALARTLGPPYTGMVLVAFFGLVAVIHGGLLHCDIGCTGTTTEGLIHNITGVTGFIATIAGMFVLARRWQHDSMWRPHARFTRGVASVAIGALVWFVVTQAADKQSFAGIAQRIMAGALLLMIATTAARLFRATGQRDRAVEHSAVTERL